MFGLDFGKLGSVGGRRSPPANAATLFAQGQPGAWYDPGDFSALYQDSAATTAVTAFEQPVGKMLDKSGRGNHLVQATAAARPLASARVNLLLNSEGNLSTTGVNSGVTNAATSIAGYAASLQFVAGADKWAYRPFTPSVGTVYTFSATVQMDDNSAPAIGAGAANDFQLGMNNLLGSGTQVITQIGGTSQYRISGNVTATTTNANWGLSKLATHSGKGFRITAYQVEANAAPTAYQRVNTAPDYDAAAAFPAYLRMDGIDDSLGSPTGGGATAGFFWCRAVNPTSGAGAVRRLWSDRVTAAFTGYSVQINAANQLEISAGDGVAYTSAASAAIVNVGTAALLTAWDDGVNLNVRVGSGTVSSAARPAVVAGTVGFSEGRDNAAATGFFTGKLYAEIYRSGTPMTPAEIAAAQAWCRGKAGL